MAEYVQAAAAGTAAVRLYRLGLAGRQPGLAVFLVFTCLSLSILASIDPLSPFYFFAFLACTGITLAVSIVGVRDIFALTFDQYPGIRTAGRRVMYGATTVAALIALAVTAFFNRGEMHSASHLYFIEILDRSIVMSLAIVSIAIVVALSHFPLHLSRNTYTSTCFLSAILLSEAAGSLFDSLSSHLFSASVDLFQVGFAAICFFVWAGMLRTEPTTRPAHRIVFDNAHEAELLRQLESLNTLLTRAGRQ